MTMQRAKAPAQSRAAGGVGTPPAQQQPPPPHTRVWIGRQGLAGELTRVVDARGLVLLAHGHCSACTQHRRVAEVLQGYRFNTLLVDLLTPEEAAAAGRPGIGPPTIDTHANTNTNANANANANAEPAADADIDLLSCRLAEALRWARAEDPAGLRCTGLFAASRAAAAALRAAALHPDWVSAVVSRGGWLDLTGPWLARVRAATLLIVAGSDPELLRLNRAAMRALRCQCRLEVLPGATPQFQEPGALETVAHLAGDWFANHRPLQVH